MSRPVSTAFRPLAAGVVRPLGGRIIGSVSRPKPTDETYPLGEVSAAEEVTPAGTIVGVVDTGVVRQALPDNLTGAAGGTAAGGTAVGPPPSRDIHPWLRGAVEATDADDDPLPEPGKPLRRDDGHGTFVSGVILREAPTARIRMVRALDADDPDLSLSIDQAGGATPTVSSSDRNRADRTVADAIRTAVHGRSDGAPQAAIVNLSFSGELWEGEPPDLIRRAILDVIADGVVVIAAAGNDPRQGRLWPAAFADWPGFDNLYAVGALDETPEWLDDGPPPVASFSNRGAWVTAYANGVDLLGPLFWFAENDPPTRYHGWARWSGTSFAAAVVTGSIVREAARTDGDVRAAARRLLRPVVDVPGLASSVAYVKSTVSEWAYSPPAADA